MSKSIREQINLAELFEKVPNRFLLTVAAAKELVKLMMAHAHLLTHLCQIHVHLILHY